MTMKTATTVSVDFDQVCLMKDISIQTCGLDRPQMFPQTPLGPVCSLHCIPSHDSKSIDFRVFLPCIPHCINLTTVVPQISLRQQLQHHCLTMLDMLGLECLQLLHPPPVVVHIFFHVITSEFQVDNAFIVFPLSIFKAALASFSTRTYSSSVALSAVSLSVVRSMKSSRDVRWRA